MLTFLKNHYYRRYHGIYEHAKKLFAFDLILLGLALVMLAASLFFFFWKPTITNLIDLSVSLGNSRIKSGEPVRLTVNFTNNSKVNLTNVSLGLKLPEGFIIDRTKTPVELFSNQSIFDGVKGIAPGASGQVELFGWFWSEPKQETRFIANLSYQPENKTSREQKFSSFTANLPESVLQSNLQIPTSVFANAPVKFTYTIKNSSDQKIDAIAITTRLNGAQIDTVETKDSNNISLPPGGSKVIEGKFIAPNKSGDFTFTINAYISANNHPISQTSNTQTLQTVSPQIISSAQILERPTFAEPGQTFPVEIKWENKSSVKLENITLHLTSNLAGVIDWKKTAVENNAKTETNGIYFDSASRTRLADGSPKNSDTFTINVHLLPTFSLAAVENAKLEIYPIMKAGTVEVTGGNFSQEGARTNLPLSTEVNLITEARYYTPEGDQLGRGPLPPQVGKTTKYWIFVKINNTSNAIEDIVFSTSLPEGVQWSGKQSTTIGPQIVYNTANRSISWQYNSLPANSQTGLYFEVVVTPQASQVGKNIQLTNTLNLSATDEFIGKKFNQVRQPVFNTLNRNDQGFDSGSKVLP